MPGEGKSSPGRVCSLKRMISVSFTLCVVLGCGLLYAESLFNWEDAYGAMSGRARQDLSAYRDLYGEPHDVVWVQVKARDGVNLMDTSVIEELYEMDATIRSLHVRLHEHSEKKFRYSDVCLLRGDGICDYISFPRLFASPNRFGPGKLSYPFVTFDSHGARRALPDLGIFLAGQEVRDGKLWGASSMMFGYRLQGGEGLEETGEWEAAEMDERNKMYRIPTGPTEPRNATKEEVWAWMQTIEREMRLPEFSESPSFTVTVFTSRSIDDAMRAAQDSIFDLRDLLLYAGVVFLVSLYASVMTYTKRTEEWKIASALAGCTAPVLAYLGSSGFLYFCGLPHTPTNLAVPFLILGIGVDDFFVILSAYALMWGDARSLRRQREGREKARPKERLSKALGEAGISITLTTATDVTGLLFGLISDCFAIRNFCAFTIMGLLFGYAVCLTFFLGYLGLDAKREAAGEKGYMGVMKRAWVMMRKPFESQSTRDAREEIAEEKSHRRLRVRASTTSLEDGTSDPSVFHENEEESEDPEEPSAFHFHTQRRDSLSSSDEDEVRREVESVDGQMDTHQLLYMHLATSQAAAPGDWPWIVPVSDSALASWHEKKQRVRARRREDGRRADFSGEDDIAILNVTGASAYPGGALVRAVDAKAAVSLGEGRVQASVLRFVQNSWARILLHPFVAGTVLLAWLALLATSVWAVAGGMGGLQYGMQVVELTNWDSPLRDFFRDYREMTGGGYVGEVFFDENVEGRRTEWWRREIQEKLVECVEGLEDEEFFRLASPPLYLFLKDKGEELREKGEDDRETFEASLREWLDNRRFFKWDFVWEDPLKRTGLRSWRFQLVERYCTDSACVRGVMEKSREYFGSFKESFSARYYHEMFLLAELDLTILNSTLIAMGGVLLAATLVSSLLLKEGGAWAVGFILVCVAAIDLSLFGVMVWWGISLNLMSATILVLAAGFAVDYIAHVCHGFTVSCSRERGSRVAEALCGIGPAVFHGAVTVFLCGLPAMFSRSAIVFLFFQLISVAIALALAHGIVVLPVLLLFFGPKDTTGEVERRREEAVGKLIERLKTDRKQVVPLEVDELHAKRGLAGLAPFNE
uniref:SSD domain-containing protein n=1 Tax=Chromera velia CCMP2878 TaxID=1169474 RepID=A0A0G4FUB9_9ALVE|eukprot:Cvel_3728.t1-p1 / transcript=Cvel_3728.t1 / gene=Cvel_3728 / organism=Chromera_velia_CCMP2878 / gene_product=Niemann-Pick C1 protein, putative / transcript_product=Niemann-Pick C1 protein, putative / location=Cvel_scaffold155:36676-43593(+) / protein_length=1096 / sequence_SO=supercontig / SO=protein_coding / is_pseudo=false